jgi:hypothetical protein
MPSINVTQSTYNFTATVSYPVNLTLSETPDQVRVTQAASTVTVVNNISPITVSGFGGAGSGVAYNQNLNTTDNVRFATVTTEKIYGPSQQPVNFPNGFTTNVVNNSAIFSQSIDVGGVYTQFNNQLQMIYALLPINFGTVNDPALFGIDMGPI